MIFLLYIRLKNYFIYKKYTYHSKSYLFVNPSLFKMIEYFKQFILEGNNLKLGKNNVVNKNLNFFFLLSQI